MDLIRGSWLSAASLLLLGVWHREVCVWWGWDGLLALSEACRGLSQQQIPAALLLPARAEPGSVLLWAWWPGWGCWEPEPGLHHQPTLPRWGPTFSSALWEAPSVSRDLSASRAGPVLSLIQRDLPGGPGGCPDPTAWGRWGTTWGVMGPAWGSIGTAWSSMGTAWGSVGPAWGSRGQPGAMLMPAQERRQRRGPTRRGAALSVPGRREGSGQPRRMQMRGCRSRNTWGDTRQSRSRLLPGPPTRCRDPPPPCWGHCPCAPQSTHPEQPRGLWAGLAPQVSSEHHLQPGQGPLAQEARAGCCGEAHPGVI